LKLTSGKVKQDFQVIGRIKTPSSSVQKTETNTEYTNCGYCQSCVAQLIIITQQKK